MSKTSPNTIAIDEKKQPMFQKIINIDDDLILKYFELATDATLEEVEIIKKRLEIGERPNILKEELAQRIIFMYHGSKYDPNDGDDENNIESKRLSEEERIRFTYQVKHQDDSGEDEIALYEDGETKIEAGFLIKWL